MGRFHGIRRIAILLFLSTAWAALACSQSVEPTAEPSPTPTLREFTLSAAPQALDLTSILPEGFTAIDAAREERSKRDLALGSSFSNVYAWVRDDPFQLTYVYLAVTTSLIERTSHDALIDDDAKISYLVREELRAALAKEGIYDASILNVSVTHPTGAGNAATLGVGTFESEEIAIGYELLMFRKGTAYVFINSFFIPGKQLSSIPAAALISNRIASRFAP